MQFTNEKRYSYTGEPILSADEAREGMERGNVVPDYHVIAWNRVDKRGRPIIEIDEDMTRDEYLARIAGKFACENVSMLWAISASAIDRMLDEQEGP